MDNLKSAFTLINGGYEARGSLYMRKINWEDYENRLWMEKQQLKNT